jgi:hypothetical protein
MKELNNLFSIFVVIMIVSGCSVGDKYKHIAPDTPRNWTDFDAESQQKNAAWPESGWWQNFNSNTMTGLVEQAKISNYDIKIAVDRVKQADAELRIVGASMLPQINAGTGATRKNSHKIIANQYDAAISASYEIDFWGKNRAVKESARALAQGAVFDQQTVALTVTSNVATTYLNLIAFKDRLKAGEANLANSKKLLGAFRKRFKLGLATSLDVAQQENEVANQEAALPNLRLQIQQNRNALAILLGKLPESFADISGSESLAALNVPEIIPSLPSELLIRRPDVQLAEANLIAANANITAARGALFPNISLTASSGYASTELAKLFTPDGVLLSLGTSITQPIFNGGALKGKLELTKVQYDELLQTYHKTVISAFLDVENALAAVKQTAATQTAQEKAQSTARNAYNLSQKQFEGGIIDITTVLNTQRSLFSAEDSFIQAKSSHLQAIIRLYKALGGGWKKEAGL